MNAIGNMRSVLRLSIESRGITVWQGEKALLYLFRISGCQKCGNG
jgi:hypothetical protein